MEKKNYRETLAFLCERYPMTLTQKETAQVLGISLGYLTKLINAKKISLVCGKIPIGSVASYLCG